MVVGMARSMLKAKKMPAAFWGEAVSTAVFILNRAPTKSLEGTTPFEAWHGRKPDVSFLRTFGCVEHVKKTKPNLAKLEDRSTPMVFLGYERGSKAYRLYDQASGKVVVSSDVVFDEAACWGWESDDGEATPGGLSSSFNVEYMAYSGARELAHGKAEGIPSSEAQGTPSSKAQGTPSTAGQGTPISASSIRFVDSLRHASAERLLEHRRRLLRRVPSISHGGRPRRHESAKAGGPRAGRPRAASGQCRGTAKLCRRRAGGMLAGDDAGRDGGGCRIKNTD